MKLSVETLLRDGDVSKAKQLEILEEIRKTAEYQDMGLCSDRSVLYHLPCDPGVVIPSVAIR